ncbi:saccharopine dehydrogenase [Candidatus Thorarchaeota archaeon]|nr:MAG: saccharopine dehydrogenase [Candidatus Thorarchaeota archaeon]
MKTVLCLGAGLVARPYVQYLCKRGYHVIVASRTKEKAEGLIQGCQSAEAVQFNIKDNDELLQELVNKSDLVCSLLPYTYHVKAAKVAIENNKHFCTTSYISDEMQELDKTAKEADVILLNECGVDPGIDHMSAQKIIDEIHDQDGRIISFTSFTGGLPAPEANDNPFGYKLSWSPRGVLLAGRNDAQFLQDGEEVTIPGSELFNNCKTMEIPEMGEFEGYPNRDSLSYIDIYDINEVETMLRGTLRYPGWCNTIQAIADLGLLDLTERELSGITYSEMIQQMLPQDRTPRNAVAKKLDLEPSDPVIERLDWLGLFSQEIVPDERNTYLDALCNLFEEKLQYASGERDMIVMHHEFVAQYPDKKEKITSTLIDYGIPDGDTSMSRTVALPVAIATRLILQGEIEARGVHRPILPQIYEPILSELKELGIELKERTTEL